MIGSPPAVSGRDGKLHRSLLRELECIREKVFEHLLQALRVCDEAAAHPRIVIDFEAEFAVFSFVTERPRNGFKQRTKKDLFRLNGYRSGLNLGEIENIADQVH